MLEVRSKFEWMMFLTRYFDVSMFRSFDSRSISVSLVRLIMFLVLRRSPLKMPFRELWNRESMFLWVKCGTGLPQLGTAHVN